jgi:hypothetical protein
MSSASRPISGCTSPSARRTRGNCAGPRGRAETRARSRLVSASAYTLNPPQGKVQGRELVLSYTRLDQDPAKLKSEIDRDIGPLKQYLEIVMQDVTPFNDSIPQLVKGRRSGAERSC